jgi:hypothetical protein
MIRDCLTLATLLALSAAPLPAQSQAARPADVASIDGMIAAFYDAISGPAGAPRQWARDSTLYIPGVRFVSMSMANGQPVAAVSDHGQYIARTNDWLVQNGFFEREIGRVTRRFGNVANVLSSYEYRSTPGGPVLGRGVNSIQLFWDGQRWWIANAIWDSERPDNPIPADLLPRE